MNEFNPYERDRERKYKVRGFLSLVAFITLILAFVRVVTYFLGQLQ